MRATIFTDIAPGNPAYREEFFGPVVSCFRVKDEVAGSQEFVSKKLVRKAQEKEPG